MSKTIDEFLDSQPVQPSQAPSAAFDKERVSQLCESIIEQKLERIVINLKSAANFHMKSYVDNDFLGNKFTADSLLEVICNLEKHSNADFSTEKTIEIETEYRLRKEQMRNKNAKHRETQDKESRRSKR